MTKQQAIRELRTLSSGTIASLTGLTNYEDIDGFVNELIKRIQFVDVSDCNNWLDVWNKVCL